MKVQVINPSIRRCKDCSFMWCKVFIAKGERLMGYCAIFRNKVTGNDLCHLPRLPPN